MFTTWRHRAKKVHAREVVLRNWRHLSPRIQPLIFTRTDVLRDRCLTENWLALPEDEIRCVNKIPTLRGMFNSAMSTVNSRLYGFSNGDLVFAKDFVKSIDAILSNESLNNKPLLILAKRLNIEYRLYRNTAFSYDDIPRIAKQGEYPKEGSSDIFITNKLFPWKQALDLVIGRMGVGMWLSAFARALNVTLIDVTNTSTVLHLTTDGNLESLKNIDMNCNHDIIKANNLTCDSYSVGFIDCADHVTNYTHNEDIRIFKKQYFNSYCFSPAFYRFVDKIKAKLSD
ncbi:hypothetical protein SNE40_012529 [Patella caerulea]|uniref:Uncharacterized protein n=1 Tax=Patella caerulea TaxID=87958 RepID=A0AAN8PQQ4_PATCE